MKASLTLILAITVCAAHSVASSPAPSLKDILRPLDLKRDEAPVEQPTASIPDVEKRPERITISDTEIVSEIQTALQQQLSLNGDLRLYPVRPIPRITAAGTTWALDLTTPPTLDSSRVVLEWAIQIDGQPTQRHRHLFKAELWDDVWAVRKPLRRGDMIEQSALEIRSVDLLAQRGIPIPVTASIENLEAVIPVIDGKPLTWRDVRQRPAIRRGEIIDLILEQGSLSITMPAQATENGAPGELITVRNIDTKREIQAVVIGPGKANVSFSRHTTQSL